MISAIKKFKEENEIPVEDVDIEKIYSLKREVENFSERQSNKMRIYLEDCEKALKMYEELLS